MTDIQDDRKVDKNVKIFIKIAMKVFSKVLKVYLCIEIFPVKNSLLIDMAIVTVRNVPHVEVLYHFQQYAVTNKYLLVLLLSSRHVHCTYLGCNYIVIRQAQTRDSVKSHYFTRQSMTSSIQDPMADYKTNNINNQIK